MLSTVIWTLIKIIQSGELNELAFEDLILSTNSNNSKGKIALGLERNVKSLDFPKGKCKVAWDRQVNKYASHSASSLLKLKCKFHNSKQELIEKDTDEWISILEGLLI